MCRLLDGSRTLNILPQETLAVLIVWHGDKVVMVERTVSFLTISGELLNTLVSLVATNVGDTFDQSAGSRPKLGKLIPEESVESMDRPHLASRSFDNENRIRTVLSTVTASHTDDGRVKHCRARQRAPSGCGTQLNLPLDSRSSSTIPILSRSAIANGLACAGR